MKKRALSLIEIMIVIFLITLVTGAIGYNMKGAVDKGKVFRTEQAKEQLYDLLWICIDEGYEIEKVAKNPKEYLEKSGIAKSPDKLTKDGWNQPFTINVVDNDLQIISEKLENYQAKK